MPDDGLHDSPGITLNMMLTDPNSVRWDARVKAKKATINGVDISNLNRSREWARAIVDARATRTVDADQAGDRREETELAPAGLLGLALGGPLSMRSRSVREHGRRIALEPAVDDAADRRRPRTPFSRSSCARLV